MSSNASPSLQAKDDKAASVDVDAIMDNVSIVLFTMTIVLGISGNCLVIWVAGFKLKVEMQEHLPMTPPPPKKKNILSAPNIRHFYSRDLLTS